MKIFYVFSFVAVASAAIIPFEGLRQQNVTTDKITEPDQNLDGTVFNDEGYKYKSVRRLKYRQRRDISEDVNAYLPPSENEAKVEAKEYLPPSVEAVTEVVAEVKSVEEPEESSVLGADGYEYKTVRRLKFRQRRDVSEIANEYLPPSEEGVTESVAEVKSVEEPEESAVLGADGYEYKTVRRLKYRQRRDVSEIANEYLPPSEEAVTESVAEVEAVEEPEESAVLGADGYEYKTVRRLKYRQRRDVSEIANEYLPPSEDVITEVVSEVKSVEEPEEAAVAEVKSVEEPEESAVLGADGYEYKTVRRLKYRQRRDVSEIADEYLPPTEVSEVKSVEEPHEAVLAEVNSVEEPEESAVLGADGYEYKTVRRLKYRQRRDVSEIANEYLPPSNQAFTESVAEVKSVEEPEEAAIAEVKSVKEPEESAVLGADGYEYKTVRRLKYRQRRDVSEIANEYLPPSEETVTESVAEVEAVEKPEESAVAERKSVQEPEESTVLGADGYEYKTVRRLKYRQRRDVSEIANEYLPPSEEAVTESVAEVKSVEEPEEVAVAEVKSVEEPEESAVLGADGYEYKTVRRLKYRQRRDVSEIANEYLPPTAEAVTESVAEVEAVEEPEESAVLGADGYEYKTVLRLKYRQRRDVSEIANEYLPPSEEAVTEVVAEVKSVEEPEVSAVAELKSVEEPEESAVLGADGYEYKTVRRLKYRQRRDVSEIANEYLPPTEGAITESVAEVEAIEEPEETAVLSADGYEYKTVRRLKYRQRRDVSEITNEYLPPNEDVVTESVAEVEAIEEPEESAVLGADGYEYKTVRRLKYRQRRDVSEIANEYLPPSEEAVTEVKSVEEPEESAVAELKSVEEPEESAVLGADGYEYKTVRRLKYRQRRDVSEIANEYLPPTEGAITESVAEVEAIEEPEETAVLGADGYAYKTVRRLKYRQRRDVSEIANEYLPPSEEAVTESVAEVKSVDEPEETAVGTDGYEYKTVRRLKYRQRRDVSEIVNEFLPPSEDAVSEYVAEVKSVEEPEEATLAEGKSIEEPEESAVLGADGYEYNTVRRLKYRQRRDVSEIANEYLPPSEETVTEVVAEVKSVEEPHEAVLAEVNSVEEPEESAVLGADGYEYKTVRRLKYRQRRDVSKIANEYLPPSEEAVTKVVAEVKSVEEPEKSAVTEVKSVEEPEESAVAELKSVEEPEESAVLGADGYEYKTVRRLKYRQRRDVSEIANEYLPPSEETVSDVVAEVKSVEEPEEVALAEVKSIEEPEESAVLGADGYEYKTVRRLKYRQRL